MFCEQCGTKCPDDALFCENCGAKIVKPEAPETPVQAEAPIPPVQQVNPIPQPTPIQPNPNGAVPPQGVPVSPQGTMYQTPVYQQPKKPFKMTPQILIPIIAGVLVIFAAIAFVVIGKASSSPEKVVKQYLEAVANQKWKKAYDMLDVEESDFLNEDSYVKMMESKNGQTITNYKIYTDFSDFEKDAITRTVNYGYTVSGQSGEFSGQLQLIKQKKKHMIFFDQWQVSENYAENCYVVAPEGAAVTVDDIELDPEEAKEYEEGYVQYNIPTMFYGIHNVKATSDIFEDAETEWDVSYSESYCYVEQRNLKESVVEDLQTTVADMVSDIYAKAFEGKEFSEISSYFTSEKNVQKDMQKSYDNLKEDFKVNESGEGFKNFSITDIEAELDYNSGASCEFDVDFDFDYEETDLNWWTNELETETGSSSESLTVYIDLVDGDWVVTSMYLPTIYIY